MTQFYMYLHCKPNGDPFYVGKGDFRRSRKFAGRNINHKRIVAKYGNENIGVFAFACKTERDAFASEIQTIAQLRKEGYVLANFTDGGDGPAGYRMSEITKAQISAKLKGKTVSAETRLKLSKIHKGKTISDAQKLTLRTANLGRKHLEETKEKIRLAQVGRALPPITDSQREQIRKAQLGTKHTPERRFKMEETKRKNRLLRAAAKLELKCLA